MIKQVTDSEIIVKTHESGLPTMVIPQPKAMSLPSNSSFNPVVHHVTQEEALEATAELEQKRFKLMGSLEVYSGIHPVHGKCLISISATSDALIIPFV